MRAVRVVAVMETCRACVSSACVLRGVGERGAVRVVRRIVTRRVVPSFVEAFLESHITSSILRAGVVLREQDAIAQVCIHRIRCFHS